MRIAKGLIARQFYFFALILFLSFILTSASAEQSLKDQLQKTLDAAVTSDSSVPGAVLLVSSPEIGTITVASGYSDKEKKTPMRVDDNFRLASISKTFVAVVALKLSAEGKLNLDDKIADLLPNTVDVERLPNGNKATVRQLMWMRSGIPDYLEYDAYTEKVKEDPTHTWKPEEAIAIVYDEDPNYEPGDDYEYSNTNYLLIQTILEKVTGKPLATLLRQYIFDPLQLKNTYLEIHETRAGGFYGLKTHGYELEDKVLKDVTTINDSLGLADGGVVSTAQDLATFVKALLQTKTLLSPNVLQQMLAPKGREHYGLGIYQEKEGNEWAWTHNGTSSGYETQYYYLPERKLTIIILTNSISGDIIDDLATEVFKIVTQYKEKLITAFVIRRSHAAL